MAKIAFFETDNYAALRLSKMLPSHKLVFSPAVLSEKNASQFSDCDAISVFIYSQIGSAIMDKLPYLKLIVTRSTGYDHIDISECKKRGISVSNIPSYGDRTVAEHTFALMLAISRRIVESVGRTREGNFSLDGLRGFELHGKTLGIFGTGKIGSHVAMLASAFGMHVIAYDKFPNKKLEKEYGLKYVRSLGVLLKNSDILSIHAPLNKQTHHLFNSKTLAQMKKGAILINTSRGSLVDTSALLDCLDSGSIAYACLDVVEDECDVKEEMQLFSSIFRKYYDPKAYSVNQKLLRHKRVLITPHNAFNSDEAVQSVLAVTCQSLNSFFAGRKIPLL